MKPLLILFEWGKFKALFSDTDVVLGGAIIWLIACSWLGLDSWRWFSIPLVAVWIVLVILERAGVIHPKNSPVPTAEPNEPSEPTG